MPWRRRRRTLSRISSTSHFTGLSWAHFCSVIGKSMIVTMARTIAPSTTDEMVKSYSVGGKDPKGNRICWEGGALQSHRLEEEDGAQQQFTDFVTYHCQHSSRPTVLKAVLWLQTVVILLARKPLQQLTCYLVSLIRKSASASGSRSPPNICRRLLW